MRSWMFDSRSLRRKLLHKLRRLMLALMLAGFGMGAGTALADTGSPTGRIPHLYWTPQWQAAWNQMAQENTPLWQYVQKSVPGKRIGDKGEYYTIAYQVTGDPTYAQAVYNWYVQEGCFGTPYKLPGGHPGWDGAENNLTFHWDAYCMVYDWCYPGWTTAQRTQYLDWLKWVTHRVLDEQGKERIRIGDTDANNGYYTGLIDTYLIAPDDPYCASLPNQKFSAIGGGMMPVGGLDYQPALGWRFGLRNALYDYLARGAAGGYINYGAEYNMNMLDTLCHLSAGEATATGQSHLPEFDGQLDAFGLLWLYQFTPDLKDYFEWGDMTNCRNIRPEDSVSATMALAGLLGQRGSSMAPYLQKLALDIYTNPQGWHSGSHPYARGLTLFNPSAPAAEWSTAGLPAGAIAPGAGILFYHPGWSPSSSFFGAMVPPNSHCDHHCTYGSDWQLYRNGEWVLTHPMTYGVCSYSYLANWISNGMSYSGLGAMKEAGGYDSGETTDQYAYLCGVTGGSYFARGAYNPPPDYVHEGTTEIVYLPCSDGSCDTVITHVRANVQNPRNLARFDSYADPEQKAMQNAPAPKVFVQHTLSQPSINGNIATWTTPGGQNVQMTSLSGSGVGLHAFTEASLPGANAFVPKELHWQVQEYWDSHQTPEPQFLCFTNVLQSANSGVTLSNIALHSTDGKVGGALLHRSGLEDWVVVFNETPSNLNAAPYAIHYQAALHNIRMLANGFTMKWSSQTGTTGVLLTGLDPSRDWSASLDGGSASALTVNPSGSCQFTVNGSGQHTLQLSVQ
ncbi:MAG TPA: hypothetical protein VKU00_01075 [Chthonomonadaceae bacterium]|nr:hypothetical protein [Chthonomonadaceae bacterium]